MFKFLFKSEHIENNSKVEKIFYFIFLSIAFFLTALDQLTKYWIVKNIKLHEGFSVIDNYFNIVHVRNNGAAWNILAGQKFILISISIIALLVVIISAKKICDGWKERFFVLGMILSGIIGNVIDRVLRGSVVDFLDFYVIDFNFLGLHIDKYHWAAFNVADMGITIGITFFIISSFIRPEIK